MRVIVAVAVGLVTGLALASFQKVTLPEKKVSSKLPEKFIATKLAGQTIAQVDGAFGSSGDVLNKDYKAAGTGVKNFSVYFEKGKVWSVTYELDPKKELGAEWWKDAMKAVGLDPTKGKLDTEESDDDYKMVVEYPGLKGSIEITRDEDPKTHTFNVAVDWADMPDEDGEVISL
ncbi:MAG: hypothetical protein JSS65_07960 [Armatimonadetes bacterium]|nr:hypothetical protein [Armatimonadota bacterium]